MYEAMAKLKSLEGEEVVVEAEAVLAGEEVGEQLLPRN